MNLRRILVILLGLLLASKGQAVQNFPDIPDNNWVFEDLQRMHKEGFIVGSIGPHYFNKPSTRRDMALLVQQCFTNIRAAADELEKQAQRPRFMATGAEADRAAKNAVAAVKDCKESAPLWQAAFMRLTREFAKDLESLGDNPEEIQHTVRSVCAGINRCQVSKPGSALVQFSDVPSSHWASKQVLELRRLGILEGYPLVGDKTGSFLSGS